MKFYVIRLSAEERDQLTKLVNTGKGAAYRRRHAEILLRADQGEHGPGERDTEIAKQVGVTRQNVEHIRKRCVLGGAGGRLGAAQTEPQSVGWCWMARVKHG